METKRGSTSTDQSFIRSVEEGAIFFTAAHVSSQSLDSTSLLPVDGILGDPELDTGKHAEIHKREKIPCQMRIRDEMAVGICLARCSQEYQA